MALTEFISANTPWLVTGYGKYGLIICFRLWVMENEISNFSIFHIPYSIISKANYECHIFHNTSPARGCLRLIHRQDIALLMSFMFTLIDVSVQLDPFHEVERK